MMNIIQKKQKPEIMAPAGNFESLNAAIKAGADSVYFGVGNLNMRAKGAINFTVKDLLKIVKLCKNHSVKTYLALNTVMYDEDLKYMRKLCDKAKLAGIDSIIASDISAIKYAHSIGMHVHTSTQLNVSNIEAVDFFSQFADVVILARELTLDQVSDIVKQIKKKKIKGPSGKIVRIETFVHGALCVSISGKCYMSLATYNHSANRGKCLQNCRRAYRVIDDETGHELVIDNKYVMSPKDLCTIAIIDKLIEAGISLFKIEGRARPPEYVYTVTKVYKEAVDSFFDGTYSQAKIKKWEKELSTVFNRGFWKNGYYLGKKLGEWCNCYGSKATKEKKFIGIAKNYFAKKKIAMFHLQAGSLSVGDNIEITGPTTGIVLAKAESMHTDAGSVKKAKKGEIITLPLSEKIRKNDKLYVIKEKKIAL